MKGVILKKIIDVDVCVTEIKNEFCLIVKVSEEEWHLLKEKEEIELFPQSTQSLSENLGKEIAESAFNIIFTDKQSQSERKNEEILKGATDLLRKIQYERRLNNEMRDNVESYYKDKKDKASGEI
jgi:hypothetical protein